MPLKSRYLIENAVYHIVTRGNQKQNVFHCERDYLNMIKLIWKYKRKYSTKIYAYCLMPNHIHMLVDPTPKENLIKFMHCLNLSYTKWHNSKYRKCGHLWQGRFKSNIIQKDQYLINCITYIEMNPVRANICHRPEDYPWNSYKARALGIHDKIVDKKVHF